MKQEGIDISNNTTRSVFDIYKERRFFDYVIIVCDKETAERCPQFTTAAKTELWPFPDPALLEGTEEEKLGKIAKIRDMIKNQIIEWIKAVK